MAKPLLDVSLKVDKKGLKHVKEMPERMAKGLFSGMQDALALAEKTTKGVYLSGKALHRRTSFLYNSIATEIKSKGKGNSLNIVGSLGTMRYDVPYGPFWEFGGKYGARSFVRPAIDDSMSKMLQFIGRSATKEMNK